MINKTFETWHFHETIYSNEDRPEVYPLGHWYLWGILILIFNKETNKAVIVNWWFCRFGTWQTASWRQTTLDILVIWTVLPSPLMDHCVHLVERWVSCTFPLVFLRSQIYVDPVLCRLLVQVLLSSCTSDYTKIYIHHVVYGIGPIILSCLSLHRIGRMLPDRFYTWFINFA